MWLRLGGVQTASKDLDKFPVIKVNCFLFYLFYSSFLSLDIVAPVWFSSIHRKRVRPTEHIVPRRSSYFPSFFFFFNKVHFAFQISCKLDQSADLSTCTALHKTSFSQWLIPVWARRHEDDAGFIHCVHACVFSLTSESVRFTDHCWCEWSRRLQTGLRAASDSCATVDLD